MTKHVQLTFDWNASPDARTPADPVPLAGSAMTGASLRWDFVERFPEPVADAVEAGLVDVSDESGEPLRALHLEHARECLAMMNARDEVREAMAHGIHPGSGRRPRTERERAKLARDNAAEHTRLTHGLEQLLEVYAQAFGDEAARAFKVQLDAWHAESPQLGEDDSIRSQATEEGPSCSPPHEEVEAREDEMPCPRPLDDAIQRRAFGEDDFGEPVVPSEEEVRALTAFQAERFDDLLDSMAHVDELLAEPNAAARDELLRRKRHLSDQYLGAMAFYAEDFGDAAARALDAWSRHKRFVDSQKADGYPPSHPWHYYAEGDGKTPMAVEAIPAAEDGTISLILPKNPKQRAAKLEQVLRDQENQLREDEARYVSLVERGVSALSEYDRTIASGGNEPLAWASAVALKFNHVSNGRARVRWLAGQLGRKMF